MLIRNSERIPRSLLQGNLQLFWKRFFNRAFKAG
jgi:hypothetical protein